MRLYGREDELGVIDRVLQGARQGGSAALVVRGEAGIGKSELLAPAVTAARAEGLRVLRATGTESEASCPSRGCTCCSAGRPTVWRSCPSGRRGRAGADRRGGGDGRR